MRVTEPRLSYRRDTPAGLPSARRDRLPTPRSISGSRTSCKASRINCFQQIAVTADEGFDSAGLRDTLGSGGHGVYSFAECVDWTINLLP